MIDAGACVGEYTLLFSELVGETGKVVAFEPDPVAERILRHNLTSNHVTNTICEGLALSEAEATVSLITESLGGSGSSITRYVNVSNNEITNVPVKSVSLDTYCAERNIKPDGLKIDTEGAELRIFRGMRKVLRDYSPWVLLEFHGAFIGSTEREEAWNEILHSAKAAFLVGGATPQYPFGADLRTGEGSPRFRLPNIPVFRVFIRY